MSFILQVPDLTEIFTKILKNLHFSQRQLSRILPDVDFRPDIIHCHDWQTGLVPVFLKDQFSDNEFYRGIKSVMTIHNLKFQGVWDVKTVRNITGLPAYYFTPDKLEAYGDANYLKGGLVYADAITTVSATYAEEIKTPFYGEHLDGLLNARSNDLRGIVNGIDYDEYNPETDAFIAKNYNIKNFRKEKVKNKQALQEELGLEKDDKKFMIGVVSRLTDQKGFDLIAYMMDELCQHGCSAGGSGNRRRALREYVPSLRMEISGQSLREHLLFRGNVPQDLCFLRCLPDAVPL